MPEQLTISPLCATVVCNQRAYEVPREVARELEALRAAEHELLTVLTDVFAWCARIERDYPSADKLCEYRVGGGGCGKCLICAARTAIAKAEGRAS